MILLVYFNCVFVYDFAAVTRPSAPPAMPSRPPLPKSASASVLNPPSTLSTKSSSDIEIDLSGLTMGSKARNNPQSMSSSALNTQPNAEKSAEVSVDFSGLMLGSKVRNRGGPPPIPVRRADSISSADSEKTDTGIAPAVPGTTELSPHNPFVTDINCQKPQVNAMVTKTVAKPGPPPIPSRSADEPKQTSVVPNRNGLSGPAMVTNNLAVQLNDDKLTGESIPTRTAPQAPPRASMTDNASKPRPPAIPSRSAVGAPEIPKRSGEEDAFPPASSSKAGPPPIPQRNYLDTGNGS